jgi:hypothetical protein
MLAVKHKLKSKRILSGAYENTFKIHTDTYENESLKVRYNSSSGPTSHSNHRERTAFTGPIMQFSFLKYYVANNAPYISTNFEVLSL